LYSRYSIVADKAIQFVLAVMTFYMINNNVGFMKTLASPVVALALAIIATFFPPIITVILATALILVHMYSVSIAALVVTALIFLIMYIFYLRFTPKMAIVVLLTPLAFALKMAYMKKAASGMQGGSVKGMMGQIGKYAKQVFQNKELWIVLVAFIICTLVVYTLRKQAIAHAWTIAVITGAVVNIVVVAIGDVAMGVHASYGSLIFGSIGAAVIGVILELFFFSVDYSRSENLQYEDDEYYYYVKAVPKIVVSTPEKTVKRINERQETEIMDTAEVRKKAKKQAQEKARQSEQGQKKKKRPASKRRNVMDADVDQELLRRSFENDPDMR